MRKWWLTSFGLVITAWPTVMLAAFNYDAAKPGNSPFKNETDLVKGLFEFGITIAGIIFVLLFLIGGLMYLGNAGNEEQTSKAKQLLVDSIIGLVLVLSAWAASTFILNRLTKPVPAATAPVIPTATSPTIPTPTVTGSGGLPTNPSSSPGNSSTSTVSPSQNPSTQTSLPTSVSAHLSVYSASQNDFMRNGDVIVAIVKNSGAKNEKIVASGLPDSIGALRLNFSPEPNATYTITVVDRSTPPKSLFERIINPTSAEQTLRLDIP